MTAKYTKNQSMAIALSKQSKEIAKLKSEIAGRDKIIGELRAQLSRIEKIAERKP